MNAKKCLLLAIVLALLLPATASAAPFSPVSGTVQFVGGGAEKSFDKRIGPYYSMPLSGGELTMRIGAYSRFLKSAPPSVREAFGMDAQEPLQEDLRGR
jgi:opacity protein-like surface antigen